MSWCHDNALRAYMRANARQIVCNGCDNTYAIVGLARDFLTLLDEFELLLKGEPSASATPEAKGQEAQRDRPQTANPPVPDLLPVATGEAR